MHQSFHQDMARDRHAQILRDAREQHMATMAEAGRASPVSLLVTRSQGLLGRLSSRSRQQHVPALHHTA